MASNLFDEDKKKDAGCNCGDAKDCECTDEGCDCADEGCDCEDGGCNCGHDHGHEHATITMTDTETGKDYTFQVEDMFEFEDELYYVLVTTDEADPELVITKVVAMEDGTEGLVSLDPEESEKVYAEYDRLCDEAEEAEDEDEDGDADSEA